VQEAQAAISQGADPAAVAARLRQMFANDPEQLRVVDQYFPAQ
jgi:hypothetical protein